MAIITKKISLSTKGNVDIINITDQLQDELQETGIRNGMVNVSVIGSTAAVTTCEYEPGLVQDIKDIFDKLIPRGRYNHDQAWGDGNGHSHLRASFLGPSLTVSFCDQQLILGTWQQVIFIDFDNRARNREIIFQFLGE